MSRDKIYHFDSSGKQVWGSHKNLRGNVTYITGHVSGLFFDCTTIKGYVKNSLRLRSSDDAKA